MAFIRGRIAFGPQALSRFTQIIEEVASELIGDGISAARRAQPKCAQGWPRGYSAWLASGGQILKLSNSC